MKNASDYVRPLGVAENHFIQVLVSNFILTRKGPNATLSLSFDDDTPAIWTRQAKDWVKENIPDFARKSKTYQKLLDAVLLDRTSISMSFDDPHFPFRYASGGVLPILRMGDREYFSFFYRDVFPVGWNIANGGADSRSELLYPITTMEREFREELIILKLPSAASRQGGRRYVFDWDDDGASDRAEYKLATTLWAETFPNMEVESFEQMKLPIQWLDGPDSIVVETPRQKPTTLSGCFLNLNAEDFGIEVDKVARIYVDEDVLLLDGEIMDQRVLGRPVGLFDVDRVCRDARRKTSTKFIPDYFFYVGRKYEGENLESVINGPFTRSLREVRTEAEINYFNEQRLKFDLCPVTRAIVRRYADSQGAVSQQASEPKPQEPKRLSEPRKAPFKFDLFISCGQGDEDLASEVYNYVTNVKKRKAFFYKKDATNRWARQLGDALESARCLVLVGSDRNRLRRRWPECEWLAFFNAMNSGRKPRDAKLIPFVVGMTTKALPILLTTCNMVLCSDIESGLPRLGELMDNPR